MDLAPPAEPQGPPTPASDHMETEAILPNLSDIDSLIPTAPGNTVEATLVHRWEITDWKDKRASRERRVYSENFEFNGGVWRILVFPTGNNGGDTLAVFLDSVTAAAEPKDSNWHMCLQFAIAVSNPDDESIFKHMTANHRYNPYELDWGFNQLIKLNALTTPLEGASQAFVVDDDRLTISIFMKAIKDETGVLWHNFMKCVGLIWGGLVSHWEVLTGVPFQLRFEKSDWIRRA
ncbi:hypothetical protein HDU98_010270 [Podochytrium sp. JEL0797]|nr:hypothetical protein HDU98_010270 [Podochytrium sp. JEL0797]